MISKDFGVDITACRKNLRQREERKDRERETRRQAARADVLAAIAAVLPGYPDVRRVHLFGSVTRPGKFRLDSDVDVAVEGTNARQYFDLWRDLEAAAPDWAIDLREINEPSYFAQTVQQRGELVYERKNAGIDS